MLLLSHSLWLPGIYRFLDVSQSPQNADVIVVLGGSGGQRETYAAHLYQQGYAPKVLISGGVNLIDHAVDLAIDNGVLKENITINDQATNTYDEAEQVLALLQELHADSALIVTDRFHTRRASATYHQVFQGYDIKLTFVSPDDRVDASNWLSSSIRDQVVSEYLKLFYYGIHYGVWPW